MHDWKLITRNNTCDKCISIQTLENVIFSTLSCMDKLNICDKLLDNSFLIYSNGIEIQILSLDPRIVFDNSQIEDLINNIGI